MRLHGISIYRLIIFSFLLLGNVFCSRNKEQSIEPTSSKYVEPMNEKKLFTSLSPDLSGVDFVNEIREDEEFNYYLYEYAYNGAGVVVEDFDKDGLKDIFFLSNHKKSIFYKNLGNLKFKRITKFAGISNDGGFCLGVTQVDINQDGLIDIYITRGGLDKSKGKFKNQLFINKGDFQFVENAEGYDIADENRGVQSSFFDFDNDNDLDLFISNTPVLNKKTSLVVDFEKESNFEINKEFFGCDKLYENVNGKYVDISNKAKILMDKSFGLNPQVGDFNNDGFLDVYVCNDFKSPDFLYINKGGSSFEESIKDVFKHTSYYSMGSDVSDFNNDGLSDLISLDMSPSDYFRSKTTMAMTSIPKFEKMVENGYHYQYMHNMLQLGQESGDFQEVSQMAGVANTDWSWSCLFADFDLDGYNDIFIANGIFRDVLDQDAKISTMSKLKANGRKPTKKDFLELVRKLPQQKLKNYIFKNKGDLTFQDKTDEWANLTETFSNGAVYVDLDNDGDLEIVTNNIDEPATILKNNAVELGLGQFASFEFDGPKNNINGLGVKVTLETSEGDMLTRQLINSRGFLSSVSNRLHFGISKEVEIKKATIKWLDGKSQIVTGLALNKHHKISYIDAIKTSTKIKENKNIFKASHFGYAHKEKYNNDYKNQLLLPYKYSHLGPSIASADINSDGFDDVFIGGAFNDNPKLLFGTSSGKFREKTPKAILDDGKFEDISALFFDADNDGDKDLYVGSGSYEFSPTSRGQQDRLYLNDGKGNFLKSDDGLPDLRVVTATVKASDYDNDGDLDLFIGAGVIPGKYPQSGESYILKNNKGKFIKDENSELSKLGLVKDAVWKDFDNDGAQDLIVVGEWTGVEVLLNKEGKLTKATKFSSLSNTKGWWNKVLVEDVDNDGDLDVIAGNLGLNMKFHASKEKPFHVYAKDFDFNGTEDIVLAKDYKGVQVPVRGRTCTSQQMPHIAQKIPTFEEFANLGVDGILGKGINSALHYEVNEFRSGIFINNKGEFTFQPFVNEVQSSIVNSILFQDFDGDGVKDLLVAGNNYQFEVETTRSDAGVGVFLKGNGKGQFDYVSNNNTGFYTKGDVRQLVHLPSLKKVIVGVNDGQHQCYSY